MSKSIYEILEDIETDYDEMESIREDLETYRKLLGIACVLLCEATSQDGSIFDSVLGDDYSWITEPSEWEDYLFSLEEARRESANEG